MIKKLWKKYKKTKSFKRLQKTFPYRALRKVYRKCKRIAGKIDKYIMFRHVYPNLYKEMSKKEVNSRKVVFIEGRMAEITNSFSYLYDKLSKDDRYDVSVVYLRMSFLKKKAYKKRCKEMICEIADASVVFLNDSSNVIACLPMREETKVVQLWHACGAFKKFGMSIADYKFGEDRKTLEKYPYHGNYTYMTVSSPEVVWAFEEAMNLQDKKGIVVPTGVSRTDYFYDNNVVEKAYRKFYDLFPYAKGKKIILYAPTFRGRVAKAKTPNKLDIMQFYEELSKEYVLVFKHHPFVKKRTKIPEECLEFAVDCTDTMSIDELLCISDICISDYSSLVFEYSLFEKPMLFYAFDLDDYYDWRGFYYDYKDFVPGPIYSENQEMIDYIKNIDTKFDKQQVIDFKNKFMGPCDGHATDRIIDLVFNDK